MSKAQYDIYRSKVIDFTRTLVVKSSASADAINRELGALGYSVNENDPESWKYYMHLAGEYHPTDQVMMIRSLDTLQDIPFTKADLVQHLATSREYREFGSYYRALVSRYPDQEDLIKGILNPVDKQTAIDAEDGQILYYDPLLVESNEENLIPRLENWTKVFSRRWLVRAYAQIDDLYVPAHLAMMYMLIPSVVMNIRLSNCHTNYAHSYHIREYLASHQKLDWAVDYMTKKQMLWLYREIRFIERNAGKQSTFQALIQNIMTERNLPLAEWNMRHLLSEMPTELAPRVEFARKTLNLDLSAAGVDTRNVIEMLEAEEGVARGNSRVMEDEAPLIREQMEFSLNDKLQTKVLESAIIDTTDATIFTLTDTLLNHWLYLSHVGRYTAVITVDNPKTGAPLVLSVKDAFIVFLYVFGKSLGLEMNNLPVLPANHVRKLVTPPRSELRAMVSEELVDEAVLDAIYANLTPVGNYISTEAFYREVKKIHEDLMAHRWIWTTRENMYERGMVEGAAMHLYQNIDLDLGATESFLDWFNDRGLDMPSFTTLEAGLLADTLVSYATGANLNVTTSLREIQTAMLRIMSTLSSYSVQYLQSINTMPLIPTDWPVPRIGALLGEGGDHIQGISIDVKLFNMRDQGFVEDRLFTVGLGEDPPLTIKGYAKDRIDNSLDITPHGAMTYLYKVELPQFNILREVYPESELADITDQDTDSYIPMGGVLLSEAFNSLISPHYAADLPDEATLLDRWNNRDPDPIPDIYGDGLSYPPLIPVNVYSDMFEMPDDPVIEMELTASELTYPVLSRSLTLNTLSYPGAFLVAILPELLYPGMQAEYTIPSLPYPTLEVIEHLDGLQYPSSLLIVEHLDQIEYPTL